MFDKLPVDLQSDIEQAIKVVLEDKEPEMANVFRELIAEKIYQDKTNTAMPSLARIIDILKNFSSGWHAHETLMYEIMKIAAETKKGDSTMMLPMLPEMPNLRRPTRRPF